MSQIDNVIKGITEEIDSMEYGTNEKKKFLLFHRSCERMNLDSSEIFNREVRNFLKKNFGEIYDSTTVVPINLKNDDYDLTFNFKYSEMFPYDWENKNE